MQSGQPAAIPHESPRLACFAIRRAAKECQRGCGKRHSRRLGVYNPLLCAHDWPTDIAVLRSQAGPGPVASDPVVSRLIAQLATLYWGNFGLVARVDRMDCPHHHQERGDQDEEPARGIALRDGLDLDNGSGEARRNSRL